MKYLHTMIRVQDVDAALDFFVGKLGMIETRRKEDEKGLFHLPCAGFRSSPIYQQKNPVPRQHPERGSWCADISYQFPFAGMAVKKLFSGNQHNLFSRHLKTGILISLREIILLICQRILNSN